MKTKKSDIKDLPKGFDIDHSLSNKYADDPFFRDKIEKANHILNTVKLPGFIKAKK